MNNLLALFNSLCPALPTSFISSFFAEVSRHVHSPVAKTVSKGQNVTFSCEGFGSFVSISWQFLDVCGDCGTVELDTTSLTASSTLTIDTSQLEVGAYTLDCVIHQDVPVREVNDKMFSAVLTVGKFYSTVTIM